MPPAGGSDGSGHQLDTGFGVGWSNNLNEGRHLGKTFGDFMRHKFFQFRGFLLRGCLSLNRFNGIEKDSFLDKLDSAKLLCANHFWI